MKIIRPLKKTETQRVLYNTPQSLWWWMGSTWLTWRSALLLLLAGQYVILQLLTGVQLLDGPRNLHWGLYVLEEPRFLLDAEDRYDRINGFPPTPSALASAGQAVDKSAPLHPWWGPLYPLMFAGIWRLTNSYTALQLVVPLASGAMILVTYAFSIRYFNRQTGFIAALLLALIPNYREHAVMAFLEPISALLLTGALWAFLERRTLLTVVLATLAVFSKVDIIFLYFGTITLMVLLNWQLPRWKATRQHIVISFVIPLLVVVPWLFIRYVIFARGMMVGGSPSPDTFSLMLPMMLEQFFVANIGIGLPALGMLLVSAGVALFYRRNAQSDVYRLLSIWLILGTLVFLVYCAMPAASNNPRIFIPALLPLTVLVADGLLQLHRLLRLSILVYLLTIMLIAHVSITSYQYIQGQLHNSALTVWQVLREKPDGYVLTDYYWDAALYARQPVTWFEKDPTFQANILHDPEHFQHYVTQHPIRYVVIPHDDQHVRQLQTHPTARLLQQLPIGRQIIWPTVNLIAPENRTFLEKHYPHQVIGDFVLFTLIPEQSLSP